MKTYLHYDAESLKDTLYKVYSTAYSISLRHLFSKKNKRSKLKYRNDFDGWRELANCLIENAEAVLIIPDGQRKPISDLVKNVLDLQTYMNCTNIYVEHLHEYKEINADKYALKPEHIKPVEALYTEIDCPEMSGEGVHIYYNTDKYAYCLAFARKDGKVSLGIDFYDIEHKRFGNCGIHDITNMFTEGHALRFILMEEHHRKAVYSLLRNMPKIAREFTNPEVSVAETLIREENRDVYHDTNENTYVGERRGTERHIIESSDRDIVIKMRTNTRYYKQCKTKGSIRHSTHARPVEHRAYYKERVLKDGTIRPAFYIVKNKGVPCTAKNRVINVTKLK